MEINKKQIAYNRSKRTEKIQYIVLHDTGNTDYGSNAAAHFQYFNGGDRQASADFFVDSTQILQVNDYNIYFSWHCGDGKGKYGITNSNSVGIELCVNPDGDYNATFTNAVELVQFLMAELGIDADHVVRHYDASRKVCPNSMSADNWALWHSFQARVQKKESIPWYNDAQWWVKVNNISDGTRPGDTCTRAEVWQMLYRALKGGAV